MTSSYPDDDRGKVAQAHPAAYGDDPRFDTVPGAIEKSSIDEALPREDEWNPLALIEPERHPLKVSSRNGKAPTAAVIYRRWTGRERLAYEDAITERMLTERLDGKLDEHGNREETIRLGTLRLFAVSLTVVGQEGFPTRPDGSPIFSGGRAAIEQDLLAFDPDTYSEIRDTALKVQPLPSENKADDKGDDGDEADLADPSREPRTPRAANDGSDA